MNLTRVCGKRIVVAENGTKMRFRLDFNMTTQPSLYFYLVARFILLGDCFS